MHDLQEVAVLLGKHADKAAAAGPRRWNCVIANGSPLPVEVRMEEEFLLLDACVNGAGLETGPELLTRTERLGGCVKFALRPGPWRIRLRAEIALTEDIDLPARIRENIAGIRQAWRRTHPHTPASCEDAGSEGAAVLPTETAAAGALSQVLAQSRWTFKETGENIAVELETDAHHRALLYADSGGVAARVEVARAADVSNISRRAAAAMLLESNGALRLVRAYMQQPPAEFACGFQTRFDSPPCWAELEHALAALSVACRVAAREVNVLLDEPVARRYLAVRNIPPIINQPEETHHGND